MTLKNKKILVIIGGGIAAYKSLDLIRLLKKNNVDVKTILTKSGKEFVTPLSLSTLTKSKTFENMFDNDAEAEIDHIALSRWADIIIVMPTTANFMSKLSLGKAEDLASTVLLAADKDILLVPAMNVRMWLHKATQTNLKILQDFGYLFLGPEKGEMACGEFGEGKMSSPRQIYAYLKNYFDKRDIVKGSSFKALVTAGPTREYIDPVRYISNESSGKQGYEIAIALNKLGIQTTLITGPSSLISPKGVRNLTVVVFALSVLVGIPLIQKAGMPVLWLGIIGFLSGLFYTAPPFRFSSRRGLGELLIGLNFGPLMVAGSTLVQTGQLLPEAFLAGVPLGFLIAAVVYINEFPDHDSDKATGKNTLIVVFGPEKARVGYVALVSGAFLSIVLLVLNGTFPSLILIALVASYFGFTSIQTLYKYYNDRLLEPANWGTIIMHSLTGVLLCVGLWF